MAGDGLLGYFLVKMTGDLNLKEQNFFKRSDDILHSKQKKNAEKQATGAKEMFCDDPNAILLIENKESISIRYELILRVQKIRNIKCFLCCFCVDTEFPRLNARTYKFEY